MCSLFEFTNLVAGYIIGVQILNVSDYGKKGINCKKAGKSYYRD